MKGRLVVVLGAGMGLLGKLRVVVGAREGGVVCVPRGYCGGELSFLGAGWRRVEGIEGVEGSRVVVIWRFQEMRGWEVEGFVRGFRGEVWVFGDGSGFSGEHWRVVGLADEVEVVRGRCVVCGEAGGLWGGRCRLCL